jgi:hypothetical protein
MLNSFFNGEQYTHEYSTKVELLLMGNYQMPEVGNHRLQGCLQSPGQNNEI